MTKATMDRMTHKMITILEIALFCSWTPLAQAHKGHHYAPEPSQSPSSNTDQEKEIKREKAHLQQINQAYLEKIKPIFSQKCMDCHSSQTRYPWYYSIPGVQQAINRDIAEAREHLDMTHDYPFKSHASILEDVDAIQDSIQTESMPPFKYRLLHPNSKLTETEKNTVSEWVNYAKGLLRK
ncbi:MAG: heme-binding domain-containing protein [Proteobacteria bacterium]|nr:heme-binding domain-containing protein [Pseudomonadota bacterium]